MTLSRGVSVPPLSEDSLNPLSSQGWRMRGAFFTFSLSTFPRVAHWPFLDLEGAHCCTSFSSARNWRQQGHQTRLVGSNKVSDVLPSLRQASSEIVPGDTDSQPASGPYFCLPRYQRAWSLDPVAPSGWITKRAVLLPQSLSCAINKPHVYFLTLLK